MCHVKLIIFEKNPPALPQFSKIGKSGGTSPLVANDLHSPDTGWAIKIDRQTFSYYGQKSFNATLKFKESKIF